MGFRNMNDFLKQATVARSQGDLSGITYALQQFSMDMENEETEEAIALALTVLEYGDFHTRWDVAKLLPKLGPSACGPLMEVLQDEEADLEQRWFAGRILGYFNTPETIACLVNILNDGSNDELKAIAAIALANLGPTAVTGLTTLLENPQTRLMATRSLSQIRHSAVISPLLTVVKDEDPQVRAIAIEALGSFRDERIMPVLINALEDHAAIVRSEAVISLGLRGDMATQWHLVESMESLLYDLNLEVCQQTAMAMGRLGTDQAIETISKVFQSSLTPIPLQIAIAKALIWMERSPALDSIAQSLTSLNETVILEIIQLLGRIETPNLKHQASQMLVDFFVSEHPTLTQTPIKQALAYALGQLRQPQTINVLQVLNADVNDSVRFHAIAAMKKLETIAT